jgi:hypothetical protein
MIPQFPNFKIVDVTDREAVESHTHSYEPYSDFNFTSLWAWDTNNQRMISELNGNLVVRFTDYSTHAPFLSFLGTNEPEHTARTIIEFCKERSLPTTLKLTPEASVKDIRHSVLTIKEDRDNFDYVYAIPELALYSGAKYTVKRRRANRFRNEHPRSHTEIIDLGNVHAQHEILQTIHKWQQNKIADNKAYDIEHERTAIERLFETAASHSLIVIAIFEDRAMLGFLIEELLQSEHVISHFWKCDTSYVGLYDALIQENARHLETLDKALLNFEQDLGIPGLRRNKQEYRPTTFLKKYFVSLSTDDASQSRDI